MKFLIKSYTMVRLACLLVLVCLCGVLLLASCSREARLVGTWCVTDKPLELGDGLPVNDVIELTFYDSGRAYAMGLNSETEFEFRCTDDTLTMDFDTIGYGIGYELRGNTLIIRSHNGSQCVFEKN